MGGVAGVAISTASTRWLIRKSNSVSSVVSGTAVDSITWSPAPGGEGLDIQRQGRHKMIEMEGRISPSTLERLDTRLLASRLVR